MPQDFDRREQTMFDELKNYREYLSVHPIHELFGIDLEKYGNVDRKQEFTTYQKVDPDETEPYPAELDDLIRLHYLVITRKVTTILEFGVGKSTVVFNHALDANRKRYGKFVSDNLRRSNPFECHTVDTGAEWLDEVRTKFDTPNVKYYLAQCEVATFGDRICTFYDPLPNVCPDLIYLDAPDQYSPRGDVRGMSTSHKDRFPMAGDILAFEHFLLPGTLIVVDGRTANARFLRLNLQRDWTYSHSVEFDQHYFELTEEPLGVYNRRQIDFCLGNEFYVRVRARSGL